MATGFSCIHCEEATCFQIINVLHDTECMTHIHASSPVQQAGQVQGSQVILIAPDPIWSGTNGVALLRVFSSCAISTFRCGLQMKSA